MNTLHGSTERNHGKVREAQSLNSPPEGTRMLLRKLFGSIVLILVTLLCVNAQAAKGKTPALGFEMTAIDGMKFDLSSLRGKVVVLDFWSTGCPPCVAELPKLNTLVEEFAGKDVVFIAPTWDDEATIKSFLTEQPFKYHIGAGAMKQVMESCSDGEGHVVIPTHYLINKDGFVETRSVGGFGFDGAMTVDEFRAGIKRMLEITLKKSVPTP